MLNLITRLTKRNRLSLTLRPITREGRSLVSKIFIPIFQHKRIKTILGSNLAFALVATSIVPSNLTLSNILGNSPDNDLVIPQATLDQTYKPQEEEYVLTIGKTQIKTNKVAQMPVENVRLTQSYYIFHPGVDLAGELGTPIKPIMPGVVESTQNLTYDYGKAVIVNHGNGITSLYAHMSKILVKQGDKVDSNTLLGLMGATGHATGPHLHLEIRDHGLSVNPITVIPQILDLNKGLLTLNQQ
ncbi:MAG TPA: M23 family metallopeptidase [Patescibacteria group bacterium]